MGLLSIILLAISVSLDSFAVSVVCGVQERKAGILSLLKIPLILAIFQAGFTVVGWLLGYLFRDVIADFAHWLAFTLLLIVGVKMIYEFFKHTEREVKALTFIFICTLGVATSIDAAAVGLSLSLLDINLYILTLVITAVTFLLSMMGLWLGKKFGNHFSKAEVVGGIILIGMGIKILVGHFL